MKDMIVSLLHVYVYELSIYKVNYACVFIITNAAAPYVRNIHQTNSNTSTTITCESYNAPPTEVTWLKDGKTLTIDGTNAQVSVGIHNIVYYRYSNTRDTEYWVSLTINDDPFKTVGEYQCIISNNFGNSSSVRTIIDGEIY